MTPLLGAISPEMQNSPYYKALAIALGRALVTSLYGEQFGDDFTLSGKTDGLQNFNNDILDADGNKMGFYGIQRGGQGEPTDEKSQMENMLRWEKMVQAGHPVPQVMHSTDGTALPKLPNTIHIPEQVIEINGEAITIEAGEYDVPEEIQGLTVITQKSFNGEAITVKDAEAFRSMGELMGSWHSVAEESLMDRMESNPLPSPVEIFPRDGENPALQVLVLKSMGLTGDENISEVIEQLNAQEGAAYESVQNVVNELDTKISKGEGALDAMEPKVRAAAEDSLKIVRELRDKISNENWFATTLERYQNAVKDLEDVGYGDLPVRPSHGDFHFGNMEELKDGDPLKEAGHDYVMFDLMGWQGDTTRIWDILQPLAINGVMTADGGFDPERAQAYIEGILSDIELTQGEIDAMPTVLEHMHLRSAATRLTSAMLSPETHMVTKPPVELMERMDRVVSEGHNKGDWAQKAYDAHQAKKGAGGPPSPDEVSSGIKPEDLGKAGDRRGPESGPRV